MTKIRFKRLMELVVSLASIFATAFCVYHGYQLFLKSPMVVQGVVTLNAKSIALFIFYHLFKLAVYCILLVLPIIAVIPAIIPYKARVIVLCVLVLVSMYFSQLLMRLISFCSM